MQYPCRHTLFSVLVTVLVAGLSGCHSVTPDEAVKASLQSALDALEREDYDAYLDMVDFGQPLDSAQMAVMRKVVIQHVAKHRAERAEVIGAEVFDARMLSDSVYMVYYRYLYADSISDVSSQKMVRHGKDWKLRVRN